MGGAGDVEDEPIRRVGRDERRVPQRPDRKPLQAGEIGRHVRLEDGDLRMHRLGDRNRQAGVEAERQGGGVGRVDQPTGTFATGDDERPIRRRRV